MPRNIRNFWVEANVDGRIKKLAPFPASRTGGLTLSLYQREGDNIVQMLTIRCTAYPDIAEGGIELTTIVIGPNTSPTEATQLCRLTTHRP